ncbi:MAG TPA: TonB-dependent receptor [Gemmatimonadaceae bacterium]|nr:TonB-dependent receptor [Gemmatimonadaceae bacterium]
MRRLTRFLLGVLLVGTAHPLLAQAPTRPTSAAPLPVSNGEVRGTVVDATAGTPIARASAAVRSKPEAVLVSGAIASADGAFRVPGLRPGTYTLRVTYLGYGPKLVEFTISDAAAVANVGAIKLSRVAAVLEGVAVTEERATMAIEPDRNAYRAKDVAPAAGNASEVLDAVPSVQVDGDGKVSLRGNENVAVQINGRPSPLRGPQLASYLKGLPANIVERVEVVPNPSARYDPEGMAGIINIVLKQNVDLGVSAGLNIGLSKSDRYNASGNVGYQSGPLTLFTNLGVNEDSRAVLGLNDRERLDALRVPLSYTEQDIDGATGFNGQNLNVNADYKLTPRDVLSNSLSLNHRANTDASSSAYTELSGARLELDRYDRLRGAESKGITFDYNVALKRTFEPRKHELSGELRFNRSHDQDHTALWRQSPDAVDPTATRIEGQLDDVDAVSKQFISQLDYTRTLAARTKLETGYKGINRWLDRDYLLQKDALGTGDWVRSDLSNAFEFDENIQAAYAVMSQGVAKFDLQAGLRAEHASRDFSLAEPANRYPYSYNSLFPSGVVMYNLSDATQMKLSYSRRIRRPGTQELNPFPSFFDIQNVFIGNPNLSPEYTDAFELGLTKNYKVGTLQLSPFYRRTKDVIRIIINTADTIDTREVTSVSFSNLATSNSWGSDVNGSLRLGPKFNGFASFNVFKMVTDGGSTSSLGSNGVTWSARVNGTTQMTSRLSLQASYFYRAPMKIERGEFAAMQMANFALKQKIDGDNSSVTLRVSDPFNTMKFRILAGDDNVTQLTERRFGARQLFVTYQYSYGQAPRVRQPRPEDQPQQGGTPFP